MAKPSTILIVDDDKTVIEQLTTHFRRIGYETIATTNSIMIQRVFEGFEVNLMFLDLRMEGLNGYEVIQKLKEKNINVPLIIITAFYEDEKDKLAAIGITRNDVLEKPFRDFTKLEAAINTKLGKRSDAEESVNDYEDDIYYSNRTKVVLVDDESEITDMLSEVLEARQYQVKTFRRGDEAQEYLLKEDADLAIIDMKVPGVPGHELIQKVMTVKPTLKIIPVSAAYAREMKDLLSQVGFDSTKLVNKPFDLYHLIAKVKAMAIEAGTLGDKSQQ